MCIVNKEEAQSPLEVQEGDSVTLVARLSPETAAVQWQKDGQTLCSGGRLLVCSEGPTRSLTIKQAELGDGGIFLCDAGDDEVHFTLHVKGEPGGVPRPCQGQEQCHLASDRDAWHSHAMLVPLAGPQLSAVLLRQRHPCCS